MMPTRLAVASLLLFFAMPVEPAPTTRRELMQSYYRDGKLLVIYSVDDAAEAKALLEAARHFESRRRTELKFLSAGEATRADVAGGSVALVGTPKSNHWIRELSSHLDLLEQSGDLLQTFSPNPLNARFPMFVVTSASDEWARKGLALRRRADVQLRRGGRTLFLGTCGDDWKLDERESRRFEIASEPTLSTEHFDYFVEGFVEPALLDFAKDNEALVNRVRELFGREDPGRHVIHLYRSLEEKGLMTDETRSAHVADGELHVVLGGDREPAVAVAELLLPGSPPRLRRGLAFVLVDPQEELDALDETARRLLGTSDPPGWNDPSSYVRDALTVSFARFLLKTEGIAAFHTQRSALEAAERRWRTELLRRDPTRTTLPETSTGFQHGFTYAHTGFGIHDGYLSERAQASLSKLARLGVDAVAIVPYSLVSQPRIVGPLSIPDRPGAETDEDVVTAIRLARSKGMTVLLKPQIWVRGSWPGVIEAETPEDEVDFFREYGRWMRHYALMAQREQVSLLAVGTELVGMTRREYAAGWASLIEDLRKLYDGKLVYAANWGQEVEQIDFWNLLDYIGVDFYYPLSLEDRPTDDELRTGFEKALRTVEEISDRYDRPVLLTEIGYGSTASPWKEPHSSDRGSSISPEDQARAYRIALSAVADETRWVRGMYWWKWPTDLRIGGSDDRSFVPNGKPAEEVVRAWYRGRLQ